MATLESVAVHINSGRMTVGYYTVENDILTMLGPDGEPMMTATLRPDDNPKAIASVLTKEIRSRMINPFWDEMNLPEPSVA